VVYFHENQLTYPDRRNEPRDQHFSFTNLTSALAADQIWFNSEFHRQSFTEALPAFLARMPDHAPRSAAAAIATRSRVVAPGIDLPEPPDGGIHDPGFRPPPAGSGEDPLILWNHRWEHDKDPDTFFATLEEVRRRGGRFRLAVVGQRFRRMPAVFRYLPEVFGDVLEVCGPLERDAYCRLLGRSDIVISAARHEFFGISVLEAIAGGAYPLLPDRLSYPEIIPAEQHPAHLYADQPDLEARLLHLLDQHPVPRATELGHHVRETYAWPRRAAAFDAALAECAAAPAR